MIVGRSIVTPFDAPTAPWHQAAVVPSFPPVPTIESLNGGFGLMMAAAAAAAAAARGPPPCLLGGNRGNSPSERMMAMTMTIMRET